jgi:hypothetical protein
MRQGILLYLWLWQRNASFVGVAFVSTSLGTLPVGAKRGDRCSVRFESSSFSKPTRRVESIHLPATSMCCFFVVVVGSSEVRVES